MQQEAVKASATKKRVAESASRKGSNKTYNKNVAKEEVDFAVAKDTADAFKNNEGFLMVHTPVSIKEALSNNDAKAALEKEWAKLEKGTKSGPAWDMNKPRSKEQVRREALKSGKKIHFGDLMDLCFEKNSQLEKSKRKYKGRVVFRGDQVKDEEGIYAVFTDQGSSSSHMASAKFLDAIARMPGCSGADSDADSAYTQVVLADMEDSVETWVTIPKHRRPKNWDPSITDPVCRLRLNLYGHPLAGLYWEKHCQKAIFAAGFVKVQGHECLYVHREKQLFLSVYVDDFKMAGKTSNLSTMWETLGKKIFLDPPVPLQSNVYLGSSQTPVEVPLKELQQKFDTWKGFFHNKGGQDRSQRMLKQPLQLNLMGKMRTKDVPFLLPWNLRSLILPTIWALSRGREKEASCKKRKSKDINIP